MLNLNSLLERITQSLNKDTYTKEAIIRIIKEKTKAEISPENINLKEGLLQITSSPVIKNEINLKEEEIKLDLKRNNILVSKITYK